MYLLCVLDAQSTIIVYVQGKNFKILNHTQSLASAQRKCPGLEFNSVLLAAGFGQSLELLTNKWVHSGIPFYMPHVENVRLRWEGRFEDANVLHDCVVMSELLTVQPSQLLAQMLPQALFPQLSHYCPSKGPRAPAVPHRDSLLLSDLSVHDHHTCQSFHFTFICN